ncbi:MAG: hypothetical protein WDO69_28500 [Pseudomonadota bacterium]
MATRKMLCTRVLLGTALASGLALFAPRLARAAGEWDRNAFDTDDLAALDQLHPGLSAVLLRGEAELRAGSVAAAVSSFEKVARGAPENALANRRHCQALTELGKRPAALQACEASIQRKPTAAGFRALSAALLSQPPTPDELTLATKLAGAARHYMRDQPWSLAATSEIAERTGDEKMLENAVLELERIAPDHYETRRARQALNGFKLPGWAWGMWAALGAAVLGTLVHAARVAVSTVRSRSQSAPVAVASLLALGVWLGASSAWAADASNGAATQPAATPESESLSQWPVNDADPKKSLPTAEQRDRNPLEFGYHMMDLADKADVAQRKGDFTAVGKYYEAMAIAVPDRAIGYRKSCEGYEKAGDTEKALAMCRGALGADGLVISDYLHFEKLLLAKPGPLTAVDIEDLSQISVHLKAEQGGMEAGLQVQCDLAERLDDLKRLRECADAMARETPNDPKLVVYQWGVAMKEEDYSRAQALIDAARKKALQPAGIEMMERATREQSAPQQRLARAFQRHTALFGVAAGLLCVAILAFALRRQFNLRAA